MNYKNKGFKILPEFEIYDPIIGKVEVIKMSEKKTYDALSPVEYEDKDKKKQTFWQKLGKAFETDKGILIKLNALPLGNTILLAEPKEKKD